MAIATAVTAKAQTERMVVEQTDGTKTEYEVSNVSRVYFYEYTPQVIEISANSKEATLNLDVAQGAKEVQTALVEAESQGVKSYTLSGDFSKLGIEFTGSAIANPFQVTSVEEIDMSGVTNFTDLPSYAFYTVNTLKKIILPETVSTIGKGAFYGCSGLETIVADGATTLGENAFSYCSSLTEISMPSATSIGYGIFAKSYSLAKVSMPKLSVITKDPAFEKSLTTIEMPELTTVEKGDFLTNTAVTAVDFPKLKSLPNNAFGGCTNLVDANLPSLESVSEGTFNGCQSLTSVSLLAATGIGKNAFSGCKSLTTIALPAATTIGDDAFKSCTSLTTLDLPSATSLGNSINEDCTALTTMKLTAKGTITTRMLEGVTDYTFSKSYLIDLTLNADKESEVTKTSGTVNGYSYTAKWHLARFKSISFEE